MDYTQSEIERALRKAGYRLTPQRREVISAVMECRRHFTPAELYEKAARRRSGIGLVTVYRTLEMLARLGFICEVHAGGNCRHYLIRPTGEHHHHLICSGCGRVVNFTGCDLTGLERRLRRETSFTISGHLLEFVGQCVDCRRREEKG
ncbi:MAG: transcriptional repressor [Dehalococcoidales bacterium]|nr:transcriptional repressor [Dehalococcoidales bacterium]